MKKQVLDVGQCGPDHATIRQFLTSNFDCDITQTDGPEDTMQALGAKPYDLVLINRKLDKDYTDGIEIVKAIKANPETAEVPVMLVTNYPEHQDAAVEAGAVRGFGKLEFEAPETLQKVRAVLG